MNNNFVLIFNTRLFGQYFETICLFFCLCLYSNEKILNKHHFVFRNWNQFFDLLLFVFSFFFIWSFFKMFYRKVQEVMEEKYRWCHAWFPSRLVNVLIWWNLIRIHGLSQWSPRKSRDSRVNSLKSHQKFQHRVWARFKY